MGDFKKRKFNGKATRQNVDMIHKARTKLKKAEIGQQCECMHKMYNHPALEPCGNQNGQAKFRCTLCGKEICISKQTMDELDHAFEVIDNQCDATKLVGKDPDSDIMRMVVQYQKDSIRMHDAMKNIMQAINNSSKKKHRDRDGASSISISWGKE